MAKPGKNLSGIFDHSLNVFKPGLYVARVWEDWHRNAIELFVFWDDHLSVMNSIVTDVLNDIAQKGDIFPFNEVSDDWIVCGGVHA